MNTPNGDRSLGGKYNPEDPNVKWVGSAPYHLFVAMTMRVTKYQLIWAIYSSQT